MLSSRATMCEPLIVTLSYQRLYVLELIGFPWVASVNCILKRGVLHCSIHFDGRVGEVCFGKCAMLCHYDDLKHWNRHANPAFLYRKGASKVHVYLTEFWFRMRLQCRRQSIDAPDTTRKHAVNIIFLTLNHSWECPKITILFVCQDQIWTGFAWLIFVKLHALKMYFKRAWCTLKARFMFLLNWKYLDFYASHTIKCI